MTARAPRTIGFAIDGPIARADLPGLCDCVSAWLERSGADVALCDVRGVDPDGVAIDALARLQLAARRRGCQVRLRRASSELLELRDFMGLADVLPDWTRPPLSLRTGAGLTRRAPGLEEEPMSSDTSRKLFANLAVEDLDESVRFFTRLGFAFDPRLTDEQATCMIVSDEAFVMLLVENRFKDVTAKELSDATTRTDAILAVSAESREQVDELADKALEAGGSPANDPIDHGFMYGRSFQDLDGHIWELIWMDPSAIAQ